MPNKASHSSELGFLAQTANVKRKKEGVACVYFGPERLAIVQSRANGNLSAFISGLVDSGLEVSPDDLDKLKALAKLRNTTVPKILAKLIATEVSRVS